ncbi:hypothetical protein [Dongia deserti]|uniref:hypothetical protein n=1 Tax=Dongia deserti TaxID=2268030 RepID=UPI0013C434B7|nr:hypothetical protein [Dongia deserti]
MTASSRALSFVCAELYRRSGSTYLRAVQLAELATRRLSSVRVRNLAELNGDVRDEVLVFNKSCLQPQFLAGVLERLPALRRHALCVADPIDLLIADEVLANFDGVIAASIGQAEHLSSRLSSPVFLVHHHVDLRLRTSAREWDGARAAYFGELVNTWHVGTLNDLVDFFSVDTTNAVDIPWARHVPFYNVHYCLRRTRSIDGFKPATKLFLAASFEAPVVIERSNDEARRLLPRDYPFFAESTELAEIRALLHRMADAFGKDEWLYAKKVMAAIDCYRPDRVLDAIEEMMRKLG